MSEKTYVSESSQESEFESNDNIQQLKELLSKPACAKSELVIRISFSFQDGED